MKNKFSDSIRHFFHVVSNIRPIVWIGLYVLAMPVFAVIYWLLPDGQFRIPDGAGTDFGSWIYYSIVTITTLGFGDYTPAHGWAQAVTAVEVMCGLVLLGFFLNAVGSMKSEIDVSSELEKQRKLHYQMEKGKLKGAAPAVLHNINLFLAYCFAVTTPRKDRQTEDVRYNPDFTVADMSDLFDPSGLPSDNSRLPAVERLIRCASSTALALDSMQNRIDLSLWPGILEYCFGFVANCQMFSSEAQIFERKERFETSTDAEGREKALEELAEFIRKGASDAMKLEAAITEALDSDQE